MKAFIPTSVYGFFNYALALALIGSTWVFDLYHVGGAAFFLPLVFGWFQLIMAIFSNHEWGFIKQFPVSMHCFLDVIGGFILMTSPWLYGYATLKGVFWPQLILGGLVFLLGIFTKSSPLTDEPRHIFRGGLIDSIGDIDEPMGH